MFVICSPDQRSEIQHLVRPMFSICQMCPLELVVSVSSEVLMLRKVGIKSTLPTSRVNLDSERGQEGADGFDESVACARLATGASAGGQSESTFHGLETGE